MSDLPNKGALADDQLKPVKEAGILFKDGIIQSIDRFDRLVDGAHNMEGNICYLEDDFVCLPGFIDAHTHICFEGSRARDYASRNSGKTYLEIAKSGGGIWDTVTHTRAASQSTLEQSLIKRASRHIADGVTTIEVKSGYGLSVEEELKMLKAIKAVGQQHKVDLVSTCLAAHVLPRDYDGNHSDYLNHLTQSLFPQLLEQKLTNRIDIFVEEEAFDQKVAKTYLQAAKQCGFNITLHADQFNSGGSHLAVELGALSADHLEASGDKEISLLAQSDVIATALPGASLGLGCDFTPARKILDAGGSVAIASDWNPGSAPMGDLLSQAAILGAYEKLTSAEVLAAMTYRAASALALNDRGVLRANYLADFNLFPTDDYREILYHQGRLKPARVWKKGELIVPCL